MKEPEYREELQNRTINPSSDSWERLSMKLTTTKVKKKGIKLQLLKYAAAILILISIGFYFSEPKEKVINSPIIVGPSLKNELNNIPEMNIDPQTEVAAKPGIYSNEKTINPEPLIPSNKEKVTEEVVDYAAIETDILEIRVADETTPDTLTETSVQTETLLSEEKLIDDEVTRLLNESKIRLLLNNEITSKNVVSAQALLNEVEGDLDKALKEKLMEKIANVLNNPKEVVTYQEN